MRRSVSNALATVSLTALVTVATSSQAITPASLGALKQLDKWKVGIVDPEGQSFCAMVNKFDKNFGLAFALSPEGYGSVAVDVTDAKFTPGDVYQVALKTNGSKAGTYPGRATSERSVVVQVGQNKAFYEALKSNAALGVGLPALNVEFTLNKFAQSYRQLVDCSQSLVGNISAPGKMPAVEVKEVEKASLAPLDRELAEISGDELADANTTDDAKDKDALFDAVEAKAESNDAAARTQLAALDAQKQSVQAEIGAQKQKSAEIAEEKQQVERKLIASTKSTGIAAPAAATGATAKLWDAQQTQAQPEVAAAPAPEQQILWNDPETAAKVEAVEAEKTAAAAKQVDEYSRGKENLDAKAASVKEEAVKIEASKTAAPENKALKASLVAKQAELARISAERVEQTNALTRKLSATQSEYDAKLQAITAERDVLKSSLATAQKSAADAQATAKASSARAAALQGQLELALEQNTAAQKSGKGEKQKLTELQGQVLKAEQEKQALQERLAAAEKEGRSLAAVQQELDRTQADKKALEARLATAEKQGADVAARAKQMEAATGSDSKQLAAIKATLAAEQAAHEKETAQLRTQMDGQNAQFEELKATYVKLLERSKQVSANADSTLAQKQKQLSDELASRDTYVAQLESKLAVLESERSAATTRANKAQEDVATVRREMQGLRKSLIVVNDDDKPAADLAAKKHADALAAAEAEVNKAETELKDAHTRISSLESQLDTTREQVTELQKSAAKQTTVAAEAQASSAKEQTRKLEAAEAEIARLKSNTAELEGKLFNAQGEGKNTVAAKQALADNNAKLASAEAEIQKLKSDNLALAGKLAQNAAQARLAPVVAPSEKLATKPAAQTPAGISAAEKVAAPVALVANDEFAAPVISEESVSAPIPSRKPAKSRSFDVRDVTSDIVARNKPARDEETARANEAAYRKMAAIEPAAGGETGADDLPAPIISRSFFDGKIPAAAHTASEPVVKLKRIAAAPVEAVVATPVIAKTVVAAPVAVPAVQKDPGFDENRAAAFLDRIMSHHRPNGAKASVRASSDASPVFATPKPVTRKLVMTTVKTAPSDLSQIETAAGTPSMPTLRSAPVMQTDVQDDNSEFPAPVTATPLNSAPARVAPVRARTSSLSSVESILSDAGISDAQFTGSEGNTRQWTTNGLSGMYEHTAAQGRSFGENAQGYIERYRGDCSQLSVSMGPVQKSASGSFARADISCPVPGNTYTTAMVFWQDAGSFNAVLHSGYPDDGAQVKGLADNVASVIGGGSAAAPALSPRAAIRKADAMVAPAAERQYRFNIRDEASASYQPAYQPSYQPAASFGAQYGRSLPANPGQGDFETLVIE
jgi:DNA repair exonuclease SbcCD ATPase subunit